MMNIFKFFEYLYPVFAVLFIYKAYNTWDVDQTMGGIYLILAVAATFMFFFKRHFRRKFEARKKESENKK